MKSQVGYIGKNSIRGWCFDEDKCLKPVKLELYIDGVKVDEQIAKTHKNKLLKSNVHPTGNVGFKFCNIALGEESIIEIKVQGEDYTLNIKKAKKIFDLYIQSRKAIAKKSLLEKKKKLCVVHVGMHKTGSSSIQVNLDRNNNQNFSYFDLGRRNHSIPIFSLFTEVPENYHVHISAGLTHRDIYKYNLEVDKMFRAHIENNIEHETFVISGEDICVLSKNALKDFKNYLEMFFETIKIVAYVRSPVSYMNSAFQQIVKEGRIKFNIDRVYPKYRFKIEKLDTVFGSSHFTLKLFHRDHLLKGDIVTDFLKENNLKVSDEAFLTSNESLSLEAVSLLYVYYILGPGRQGSRKLIKILENFGSKKVKLGKEVLKPILDKNSEDIQWIEERMQLKLLDEYNYATDDKAINTEADLVNMAKRSIPQLKQFIGNEKVIKNLKNDPLNDIIMLLKVLLK